MRVLRGTMSLPAQKLLRGCAWAALGMAMLVSLPFLLHVLEHAIGWITHFPLIPERSLQRLLWTR